MKVLYVVILISIGIIATKANNITFGDLNHIGKLIFQIQYRTDADGNPNYREYGYSSDEPGKVIIGTIIVVDESAKSTGNMYLKDGGPGYDYAILHWVPFTSVATHGKINFYGN